MTLTYKCLFPPSGSSLFSHIGVFFLFFYPKHRTESQIHTVVTQVGNKPPKKPKSGLIFSADFCQTFPLSLSIFLLPFPRLCFSPADGAAISSHRRRDGPQTTYASPGLPQTFTAHFLKGGKKKKKSPA